MALTGQNWIKQMLKERILKEVERFLKKKKMADTAFGKAFCGDGAFVRRLRDPKLDIFCSTVDNCREFMAENK